MTSKQRVQMYADIERHGNNLNEIFNTHLPPIDLCKKLHRLEKVAHKLATDYCNGDNGVTSENWDDKCKPILEKAYKILFAYRFNVRLKNAIFINGDARGYALKIKDDFMRDKAPRLYTDMGGYGIIAPDFTPNN